MADDVKTIFEAISQKSNNYKTLFDYYDGKHPLKYSTEKLRRAFERVGAYFAQNWIAVVVDAVLDRLIIKGFDAQDEMVNAAIDAAWRDNQLDIVSQDCHEAACITGEGFIIADVLTDGSIRYYNNDPRLCHALYDDNQPNEIRVAGKLWVDTVEDLTRLNLYYPDRIEKYKARGANTAGGFELAEVSPLPTPFYPIFHYSLKARDTSASLISPATLSLQDAINKLFSDMLIASEFNSAKLRFIISQADPGDISASPGLMTWLPAAVEGQGTDIKEFGGDDLGKYIDAAMKIAETMAVVTRTPRHYLIGTGANISGDALIAMETPLHNKVERIKERLDVTWTKLGRSLSAWLGINNSGAITTVWQPVITSQPYVAAQTLRENVASGIPLVTALRIAGWGQDEIERLMQDAREERAQRESIARVVLERIRAEDAANNET